MQFLKIPNSILQMELQPAEKMLLAYLLGFGKNELHMTNQRISRDLKLSRNQTERGLANLKKAGLIETTGRGKQRRIEVRANPQKRGMTNPQKRGMPTLKNEGCQPAKMRDDINIYNNNIDSNNDTTIDNNIDTNKDIRVIEEKSELYITHTRAHTHVDYILNKLANFYPSKFKKMSLDDKKTLVTVWRETFKAESQEDLEAAFLSYTARARFFPYPAEFKKEVDSHRQAREFQKEQENQKQKPEEMTEEEKAKSDALLADLMEVFGHDTK